jgi:hypothetical protein
MDIRVTCLPAQPLVSLTDIVVYEVAGGGSTPDVDAAFSSHTSTAANVTAPQLTLSTAGDLVLSQFDGYYPYTSPTGTPTPTADLNNSSTDTLVAHQMLSGTSYTAPSSTTTAGGTTTAAIALAPASGGGGTTTTTATTTTTQPTTTTTGGGGGGWDDSHDAAAMGWPVPGPNDRPLLHEGALV